MTNTADTFIIHDTVVDDIFLADDGICVNLYPYELNYIRGLTAYPQIPVNAMLLILSAGWDNWQYTNPLYEDELYPDGGMFPESTLEIEQDQDVFHITLWFINKDGCKEIVLDDTLARDTLMSLEEEFEEGW